MADVATRLEGKLPAFPKYLLEKSLVPANQAPFFANRVSRFLDYARKKEVQALGYQETVVLEFMDILKSDRQVLDWQYNQAGDAIRLYYFHYLQKQDARTAKAVSKASSLKIIEETKRLLRLKHYSCSTERTYLQWIKRFLEYVAQGGKKHFSETDAPDFRNFISHLALEPRVSASTQNQAFKALLFLFRQVLGKEVDRLAGLLYGAGLRLMELARLTVKEGLKQHLPEVRKLHEIETGNGKVR
jgi:site-specific recombinase XerC